MDAVCPNTAVRPRMQPKSISHASILLIGLASRKENEMPSGVWIRSLSIFQPRSREV